jgi:hypothetical protein
MEQIEISKLLKKFIEWIDNGEIQYLEEITDQKEKRDGKKELKKLINKLYFEVNEAESHGNMSQINWHKSHMVGRDLWRRLVSFSLNSIDPDSKGNSKLFNFLEATTEFEDILYGLEKYYRDHTLHSLWVYLIGEYILRECLTDVNKNLNWYLINDIEQEKSKYKDEFEKRVVSAASKREKTLNDEINKKRDAIWCIISLCHDLGYSLAKLKELNKKVKTVLSYFDLPDFRHVGYSLDIDHQYHVTKFLELMSMDVWIVPSDNLKPSVSIDTHYNYDSDTDPEADDKVLIKCYRDDSTYWRLCQAFEKKKHGILSSYLIYKILDIFADSWLIGTGEEWGLDIEAAKDNIIRGDILYAIAQHDFDFAHLSQLSSLSDILLLSDELEEFSRYGRQLLARNYRDTIAKASIGFKKKTSKEIKSIAIKIEYDVDKHLDKDNYYHYFIRKAERLCKIYSLGLEQKKEIKNYYYIDSIEMIVKSERRGLLKMAFKLSKVEADSKAYLPKTKYKDNNDKEHIAHKGRYPIICVDDKIYVKHDGNQVLLKDWLGIKSS